MSELHFILKVNKRGYIGFYLTSGKYTLHDLAPKQVALDIIAKGKVTVSDRIDGFPLCVDDKYYLEAEIVKSKRG